MQKYSVGYMKLQNSFNEITWSDRWVIKMHVSFYILPDLYKALYLNMIKYN